MGRELQLWQLSIPRCADSAWAGDFSLPAESYRTELTGGSGLDSDPAPRDSSSPVSSLLTVIEWYFELTSKWQGPGNQDTTHPTIMQLP